MLKKNQSERRFNTAAARIVLSNKLPSDFFLPKDKQRRQSSLYCFKQQPSNQKDLFMFTFHRSASEDKLKISKRTSNPPIPKLFHRSKQFRLDSSQKLPQVSVAIPKENINVDWFKDFTGKDKLKKLCRNSRAQQSVFGRDATNSIVQ